jgi:putative alpha-1,2-mannosidase
MYAEFGEKKKSRKILKKMIKEVFSYKDDGFPGDEDNGTMAAWYIFAVLGFYPTCPGKDEFTVSGKLVRSAKLRVGNKKINFGTKLLGKNKIKYADIMK